MTTPQTSKESTDQFTTAPILNPTPGSSAHLQAEFYRLPKPGTLDPIFQLSRSTWNILILPCAANDFKPPIQSVSLRKRGSVRGVRLIVADSARAYFNALIAEANQSTEVNTDSI